MTKVVDESYGGKASYGKLNALTACAYSAGTAVGPVILSAISDYIGAYRSVSQEKKKLNFF